MNNLDFRKPKIKLRLAHQILDVFFFLNKDVCVQSYFPCGEKTVQRNPKIAMTFMTTV